MKRTITSCVVLLASASGCASAEDAPVQPPMTLMQACQFDVKGDKKDEWRREPKAEKWVTQHRLSAAGKSFEYTATAGTLVIRDDEDKPIANIGYIAYTRRDVKEVNRRPLMFAFNGGPGSSSIWLHMGVLGPKRVVLADPAPPPPAPYRAVDNEFGMLDKADLVMIDPVGTGISRAVCDKKDEEFWGVDADVDSLSRFIAQYVTDNHRWSAPKYLIGESYGTTRGAAIADHLRATRSLTFNGLILVSVATDIEAIFAQLPGNDRPYAVYLPGFAAVSWYHRQVPGQPAALEPFLAEVREYAAGPFSAALTKGDALSDAERDAVAQKVHEYTGLPVEYVKAANLRISESAFTQQLLRSQRRTVSRLDGRYTGATKDPLQKDAEYDPNLAAIGAAFTAAFLDYYHRDLRADVGKTYRPANFEIGDKWKWTHEPTTAGGRQPIVNSGVDLAQALVQDSNLQVLVLNGYYDLATPFSATEYMMSHLGVPPAASARIKMEYYEAGHMMYLHQPSLQKMKSDLDAFIDRTSRR